MANMQKVTVTMPTASVEMIRALVADGKTDNVSAFVAHAVEVALDDVAGWGAMLTQALAETGGAVNDDERAWARSVLGLGTSSQVA